ncbi:MAG: hypothetical protein AVDCRST_MAG18-4158, partial [uncultured Thermomicrobiales bacterium]
STASSRPRAMTYHPPRCAASWSCSRARLPSPISGPTTYVRIVCCGPATTRRTG